MAVKNKNKKIDIPLLAVILTLVVVGLVILYSASTVVSFSKAGNNYYFFTHQIYFGIIPGLLALFLFSKFDYRKLQKISPLLIGLAIVLLIVVLIPHGGSIKVGNSRRWIDLGPITVQVSEFAKLALILYIASWLDKRGKNLHNFSAGLVPMLSVIAIVCALVFLEPDIGTMLVIGAVSLAMLYIGGTQRKHLGAIISTALALLLIVTLVEPYRVQRFVTFLNPSHDPTGISYQINQALLAVGSGGFFGYGYGNSRQKYNFLPEVMGDSIFAVTAEELGFIVSALIIGVYLFFAYRGLKVANNAPDTFGRMAAVGIVAWVSLQALINIGAIIGVLPLTGVPLPLISYGSSAAIATLAGLGILLNISKHSTV